MGDNRQKRQRPRSHQRGVGFPIGRSVGIEEPHSSEQAAQAGDPLTPAERERLVKHGKPLGTKIKELITIVSPRTFARWLSGETKSVGKQAGKGGRPRG